ncbi:hypothetical protein [Puerhibacterium sp. TATVAM-FAB25]|uniref:hypothetical protein n=1 Tax=Puerhibacterium sp. TATVAM-FAB25 TaxID=3093699 RepID=UPI00397B4CED
MSRPTDRTPWPQRARSLAPRQYRTADEQVVPAPQPFPVRAWLVTVAGDDLEVEGEAVAWTRRAVHVRFTDKHGRPDDAWVWVGAVARR